MKKRIWILGASDPEMAAIERLLNDAGETVVIATADGKRVHPGNAYRHDPVDLEQFATLGGHYVIAVECEGTHHAIGEPGGALCSPDLRIDHHRPGDPGYGKPPEDYWTASSLGQVCRMFNYGAEPGDSDYDGIFRIVTWQSDYDLSDCESVCVDNAHLIAAADHCLTAAYRGKCPGVDPNELMTWRIASRAAFQKRPEADVLADVEAARKTLRAADMESLSAGIDQYGQCSSCGVKCSATEEDESWDYCVCPTFRDLRGRHVPELPEASAREGLCFISDGVPSPDGRVKVVCQSGTPDQIRAFMEEWAPAEGLVDIYGDPARGFAGGYASCEP